MNFFSRLVFPVLISTLLAVPVHLQAQEIKREVKETRLAFLNNEELINSSLSYNYGMTSVVYGVKNGKKQQLVINGKKGPLFDSVHSPIFSPSGTDLVYAARSNNKWNWVFANGKTLDAGEASQIIWVTYAPGKNNIAYVMKKENRSYLVYKGKKSKGYDDIDQNSIRFMNTGNKPIFIAKLGNKQLVVADGIESEPFERVQYAVSSSDGKRIAFLATVAGKNYLVVDGQKKGPYEEVGSVTFSQNGKHIAYQAKVDNKQVAVMDTVMSEKYELVHSVGFSPDGEHYAYGFQKPAIGKEEFNDYVYRDGKISEAYETVVEGSFKFSSDSKSLAFEAEKHDFFFVACDGKEGKHYGDVIQSTILFSPDNKHLAYGAEINSKRYVIKDDVEGFPCQDIYSISFSPDSRHVAYSAKIDKKEMVVVDGIKGGSYDSILGQGQLTFDSNLGLHYLAMRGNEILRVDETLKLPK
jgi:roadblock/LC7 domain-containing protein